MGKKLTTQDFISKAKEKHNNFFTYDKAFYKNTKTKLIITCPKHGDFKQTPDAHLRGQGCPACGSLKNKSHQSKSALTFINEAQIVHNNLYDYSKTVYVNCMTPVIITCPKHGDFKQIPNNHLRGAGCKKCANTNLAIKRTLSTETFIELAKKVHGDNYNYKKVDYKKSKTPVIIICKKHGSFLQMPDKHLRGAGCPKCIGNVSKPELDLQTFLKKNDIYYESSDRKLIKPYELDIIIPEYKIAIEYCGLYWHSETALNRVSHPRLYHKHKTDLCDALGYKLITIFEPEWLLKKDIIKSILLAKCNRYTTKIGARSCIIKELSVQEAKKFFNSHHIQGFAPGNHYGLFFKNTLVSAITFSTSSGTTFLSRFVNKKYFLVYGAFSRLLKYYVLLTSCNSIITFADRRYFNGDVYETNGFNLKATVDPSYYYFSNALELLHKRNFQHSKLQKYLTIYDPHMTEYENCLNNGYNRIWDCGKLKFEKYY